jgi:ribose 5-phosphate isomerase A
MTDPQTAAKRRAAIEAAGRVASGMIVGLGSGSTATFVVEEIGRRLRAGELSHFVGIPTSLATQRQAEGLGIPLGTLEEHPVVDLTIDGADEVDPDGQLIKGLGGALLREKLVALAARRFVVIAGESKRVRRLGTRAPLPVEVVPFGWSTHDAFFRKLGAEPELRRKEDGAPYRTDGGNYIVHCRFPKGLADPAAVARALAKRPGIVEDGLFLGMASEAVIAGAKGVKVLKRR